MARAVDVAAAIRDLCRTTPGTVKVHKLLYYCQAWHVTWTGGPLFEETVEAWANGPVVADLWRAERYDPPVAPAELDRDEFETVRYVVKRYGQRWGSQLIGDTHAEAPWRQAWDQGQNAPIDVEAMRQFFAQDPAADQSWFWSDEWQAGESEADEDIREGRTDVHLSEEGFLASIEDGTL